MTAGRSVSSSVEVSVDPATAFAVFTDELDLWWVRGPINYYDSARALGLRCEPGVGGRLVEVYDETTGEGLELARITTWEPGTRLAWQSSLDDVQVEVRFEPIATGTAVRVVATIPDGGRDTGGSSWVRVTPVWFGGWCARRDRDRSDRRPAGLARLAVAVHYAKPAAAARWLEQAFGFEPAGRIPTDDEPSGDWIELRVGNCAVLVFPLDGDLPDGAPPTHTPWVFVDDLDAHFARATAAGARIVNEIWQHGVRAYDAADPEGRRWTFAQAAPYQR